MILPDHYQHQATPHDLWKCLHIYRNSKLTLNIPNKVIRFLVTSCHNSAVGDSIVNGRFKSGSVSNVEPNKNNPHNPHNPNPNTKKLLNRGFSFLYNKRSPRSKDLVEECFLAFFGGAMRYFPLKTMNIQFRWAHDLQLPIEHTGDGLTFPYR